MKTATHFVYGFQLDDLEAEIWFSNQQKIQAAFPMKVASYVFLPLTETKSNENTGIQTRSHQLIKHVIESVPTFCLQL